MTLVITNNAQTSLLTQLETTGTSLTVEDGSIFPDISDTDDKWFPLTLIHENGLDYEIVHATARDGNTITVKRGQENTPLLTLFPAGAIVSLRMTSGAYEQFLQPGDDNVFFKAINQATQVNAVNDPIQLVANGVTLSDGLQLSFTPVGDSVGDVTIILNGSDPSELRIPYAPAQRQVTTDDLLDGRMYTIRFHEPDDRWYLETTIQIDTALATSTSAGLVETLAEDSQDVFDDQDDPTSTSGAPKVPTRKGASQMIRDFRQRVPMGYLPAQWSYRGNGGDGASSGTVLAHAYRSLMFTEAIIANGISVEAGKGGTSVIRSQGVFNLNGELDIGVHYSRHPEGFVGPSGAYLERAGGNTNRRVPPHWVPPQLPVSGLRASESFVTPMHIRNAIDQGISLNMFHGGNGFGNAGLERFWDGNTDKKYNDHYCAGRSGMIIVCEDAVIGPNAKINMPTVTYTRPDWPADTDYKLVEKTVPDTKNSNPNEPALTVDDIFRYTSSGGGGLMIIVSDSISIDPGSQWRLDQVLEPYQLFSALECAPSAQFTLDRKFDYAGQGQLFHINAQTGAIRRYL